MNTNCKKCNIKDSTCPYITIVVKDGKTSYYCPNMKPIQNDLVKGDVKKGDIIEYHNAQLGLLRGKVIRINPKTVKIEDLTYGWQCNLHYGGFNIIKE